MARTRYIKPGFFFNTQLAQLDTSVRLLFIALWTIADRAGRLKDDPLRIKAETLPYDDVDIDSALSQLQISGFIKRYEVKGCKCIQIINWEKHQFPHYKERESLIPAPGKTRERLGKDPDKVQYLPSTSPPLLPLMGNGEWVMGNGEPPPPDDFSIIPEPIKARLRLWQHGSSVVWVEIAKWVANGTPEEWMLAAIDAAEKANATNANYLRAALEGMKRDGGPGQKKEPQKAPPWHLHLDLPSSHSGCDSCNRAGRAQSTSAVVEVNGEWLCKECYEKPQEVEF